MHDLHPQSCISVMALVVPQNSVLENSCVLLSPVNDILTISNLLKYICRCIFDSLPDSAGARRNASLTARVCYWAAP